MSRISIHQEAVVRGDELASAHRNLDSEAAFAGQRETAVRAIADLLHFVASEQPSLPTFELAWEAASVACFELSEHESEIF